MKQYEDAMENALVIANAWYEEHRNSNGNVNTNVMTSGIAIAELLKTQWPLTKDSITTRGGSQVKGMSGGLIKRVLAAHGEKRQFTAEGGRTSRGTLRIATELALNLSSVLGNYDLDNEHRTIVANKLQDFFVECIEKDFFNKERLKVTFNIEHSTANTVKTILETADLRSDHPTGAVAQHLVGAKLELRFPSLNIGRDQANAADQQTDRQGDFQIGDTAFHVTVAPSVKLIDRAKSNLQQGFRPVMLVREDKVTFTEDLFESEGIGEQVDVQSIESFVGTNIGEMASFTRSGIQTKTAMLIRRYNERIESAEPDKSLRIEEPSWMVEMLERAATDRQYGVLGADMAPLVSDY